MQKKLIIPIVILMSLVVLMNLMIHKFEQYEKSKWKKINIEYGEMVEIPELEFKKLITTQQVVFYIIEDKIIWGISNDSFDNSNENHYFEYGSFNLNFENMKIAEQKNTPYKRSETSLYNEGNGLNYSLRGEKTYTIKTSNFITSSLKDIALPYNEYKHDGLGRTFELSDDRLLHLIYKTDYKNNKDDQELCLLNVKDNKASVAKKMNMFELFSNEKEKINTITVDEKNIYIATSNKKVKMYNHELELKKELDLFDLVSDDFEEYLELQYVESKEKNIVQVAPEKFYWLDKNGALEEWQEQKENDMSDSIVVFQMRSSLFSENKVVESKRYLLDLKQERIISTIEYAKYGEDANEKAEERPSFWNFQTDSNGNLYFNASSNSGEKIFNHLAINDTALYDRKYIVKIEKKYILDFLKEFNKN